MAAERFWTERGIRFGSIELRMMIQSELSGLGIPNVYQTPGAPGAQPPSVGRPGGAQPPASGTPTATPIPAASVGAPAARSETGALLPAPTGSTPGVEH